MHWFLEHFWRLPPHLTDLFITSLIASCDSLIFSVCWLLSRFLSHCCKMCACCFESMIEETLVELGSIAAHSVENYVESGDTIFLRHQLPFTCKIVATLSRNQCHLMHLQYTLLCGTQTQFTLHLVSKVHCMHTFHPCRSRKLASTAVCCILRAATKEEKPVLATVHLLLLQQIYFDYMCLYV